MKLLLFLLLVPYYVCSQSIECPLGQIKKKVNGHWKCVDDDTQPLPVNLIYFKGIQDRDSVKLYWSTAQEVNNSHFIIQSSTDAIRFKDVVIIHSSNTTTNQQQYYNCIIPYSPYYRLVQVDLDNTNTYYSIITVKYQPNQSSRRRTDSIGRLIN